MAKPSAHETASNDLRYFNELVLVQIELMTTAVAQSREAVLTSQELVARVEKQLTRK